MNPCPLGKKKLNNIELEQHKKLVYSSARKFFMKIKTKQNIILL